MRPLQVILCAGMISGLSLTAWAQSSAPVPKPKSKVQTYAAGHDPITLEQLQQQGRRYCEPGVGGVLICTPWNGGGAEFIYKGD